MQQIVPLHIQGHVVGQKRDDGYINATAMCQATGKRLNNYTRASSTKEFINILSAETRIRATELIQTVRGGTPEFQGTWVHPQVAIHLGSWLSQKFAVRVASIVMDWMRGSPRHRTYEPLLLHSPSEWQKRFQDEVFTELARIYGHERRPEASNWPQWMGAILKDDFYGRLDPELPDLPDELDNRNPVLESGYRDHKHHQDLTEDVGLPRVMEHMGRFVMLLKVSRDPYDFRKNLAAHLPKIGDQFKFDL